MSRARRIEPASGCPLPRGKRVSITFEGRCLEAFEGEPLAVALLAAGVDVFSRSPKYHRPRGPFCLHGHCSSCLMRVDGIPSVRTCQTPCRSGMQVERQTGWPSAQFDLWRALDWAFGERMDHHSFMVAPAVLNRLAAPFVRRLSGFGDLPSADPPPPADFDEIQVETMVLGGGPAGLTAALALAECGCRATLLEAKGQIGGRLLDGPDGFLRLARINERLNAQPGLEIHQSTPVVAVFPEDFRVIATGPSRTICLRPQRMVVCSGDYQQAPLLGGNDLPGLFGLRALERLVFLHGLVPPEPIVLCGSGPEVARIATGLVRAGVRLAAVVSPAAEEKATAELVRAGIMLVHDRRVTGLRGSRCLDGVELSPLAGGPPDRLIECSSCAVESPAAPAYELAHHAGCRVAFRSEGGFFVAVDDAGRTSNAHIFAAGHCSGSGDLDWALAAGERAGLSCALSLGENPRAAERLRSLKPAEAGRP